MGQTANTLKRILFVDDDANVLTGLRNVLRTKRREWEMVFAIGPEEALANLAKGSFDVVVSDMRMPRMDGATLLTKVKEMQPWAVRMILSGQTELESAMKSVFVAHMFLSKPCDPALLTSVVDRACCLNTILRSEELRSAAGKVQMLPTAPKTYVALNAALMKPACTVATLVQIVERDVGLSAKLLQLVNSAFFGLPKRIASLSDTVTYLGFATIKNLALALETFSAAAQTSGLSEAKLMAIQDHSLLTGQIAQQIEASATKKKMEGAFLAGVLHEVGWLLNVKNSSGQNSDEPVERELLGAYLLGLWGLPHAIMEAVAYHRKPHVVVHSTFELVDIIYVADHFATELRGTGGTGGTGLNDEKLDLDYLAGIGIDEAQLAGMRVIAEKAAGIALEDSEDKTMAKVER
jgi:HD-like signal output (HDOD) protein/ActR/RegA family two-component response regulator